MEARVAIRTSTPGQSGSGSTASALTDGVSTPSTESVSRRVSKFGGSVPACFKRAANSPEMTISFTFPQMGFWSSGYELLTLGCKNNERAR